MAKTKTISNNKVMIKALWSVIRRRGCLRRIMRRLWHRSGAFNFAQQGITARDSRTAASGDSGEAAALFWPKLIHLPVIQARHLEYHWGGANVTKYFVIGEEDWRALPAP